MQGASEIACVRTRLGADDASIGATSVVVRLSEQAYARYGDITRGCFSRGKELERWIRRWYATPVSVRKR